MGPYEVTPLRMVRLAIAGIKEEYIIYYSVSVNVIFAEVDLRIQCIESLFDSLPPR